MIIRTHVRQQEPRPVPGPDGNASDLRYLEVAVAALEPIMAACAAAAAQSSQADVRAVARAALSVQTDRLSAISALLDAWGQPPITRPRSDEADAPANPDAGAREQVFLARLTAYTHASIADARAEMVAGASRAARLLAEQAIHADDRQLAALRDSIPPAHPGQTGPEALHDSPE